MSNHRGDGGDLIRCWCGRFLGEQSRGPMSKKSGIKPQENDLAGDIARCQKSALQ